MEIKVEITGDDTEIARFLRNIMIGTHNKEKEKTAKTEVPKKRGRPKKNTKATMESSSSDDILDDPEMSEIGAHIFGDGD